MNLWEVEGCFLGGDAGVGKAYFKEFFFFFSRPGLVFLPKRCILLPSGCYWECLWSSREPSHSPVFPKMPSYTFDKTHTIGILPFIWIKAPILPLLQDQWTLPHCFRRIPVWTSGTGCINWMQDEGINLQDLITQRGNVDGEWIAIISIAFAKKTKRKVRGVLLSLSSRWESIVFCFFVLLPWLSTETALLIKTDYETELKLALWSQCASSIKYVLP